jgi:hypothetical protein
MSGTTSANFYRVQRRNGPYYAVHDPSSGRLWTERSEEAARAQAEELGLSPGPLKSITHDELMRLLGREAPQAEPTSPRARTSQPETNVSHPIRSRGSLAGNQAPAVILSKSDSPAASNFASGEPVADAQKTPTGDDTPSDDVIESRRKLPKGFPRNPFSTGPKQRRRS